MHIIGPVPKVGVPSAVTFRDEFANAHKPVIICGAAETWPARWKWNREYLEKAIGPRMVRVKESPSHIHPDFFSGQAPRYHEIKFTDYVALIWSDNPHRNRQYLTGDEAQIVGRNNAVDLPLASLASDIAFPLYVEREKLNSCGFWLSAGGLFAALHYDADGSHNLNVQVRGRKRVLLFSPQQYIYPFLGTAPSRARANFSQVNVEAPDIQRFPQFEHAQCYEAMLEEGEMLFIPSFWSHAVEHLGRINMNVNFWWTPDHYVMSKTALRFWLLRLFVKTLTNGKPFPSKEEIEIAMRSLNPETLEFLQNMEKGIRDLHRI